MLSPKRAGSLPASLPAASGSSTVMVHGRTPTVGRWVKVAPGEAVSAVLLFWVPVSTGSEPQAAADTDC